MTAQDFTDAVRAAKRGDRIRYHTGFLFADRQHNPVVDMTGYAAWKEHLDGRVALFQQRVDAVQGCEYIAVVL